jgi:hypothetical protein
MMTGSFLVQPENNAETPLAGCGKSKLEAWQLKHFIVELFYARPRSSAVGDLQLLVA